MGQPPAAGGQVASSQQPGSQRLGASSQAKAGSIIVGRLLPVTFWLRLRETGSSSRCKRPGVALGAKEWLSAPETGSSSRCKRPVVALGAKAFHASLQCFGFDKIQLSDAIVDKTGIEIVDGVHLFAAYHCGAGTINRNRDMLQQKKDWTRIGKALGSQKS